MVLISLNENMLWCKPLHHALILLRNLVRVFYFPIFSQQQWQHNDKLSNFTYCSISSAIMTCHWHHVHRNMMVFCHCHVTFYSLLSLSFCPSILQELLPLVLSFELPAIMQSDPSSPTVQHISQTYNLTVSFKPPTRLYRATGVVRGSQNNTNAVKVRRVS